MITLQIYAVNDVVVWSMAALRPAHEWRALGSRYWDRRGEVILDAAPDSHRAMITAALTAIMDRLGER